MTSQGKKMLPEYNKARQELKELFLFMGRGIIFHFLGYKLYISARTHSISGLKSLEIDIFDLKMMVKSLDFF